MPFSLPYRVRAEPDPGSERAALGLGWRLEAAAVRGEQPAVEAAAQAAVLQSPQREVRAPVRAAAVD